jgi:DnaJ-domain-containing protein 1
MKQLTPHQRLQLKRLDAARAMLVVNGVLRKRESQAVKKRLRQLFSEEKQVQLVQIQSWR